MTEKQIREELYNKLDKEYDNFIEDLKAKTPDEIIDKSYEKVMKEELKEMFYPDNERFDISDIKILNKSKSTLEELYQGWMDTDYGIHEQLEYSVEDTIEFLKNQQAKEKNKSMER
jgi:translation initiation factor 2 beta subunit (eIF-2beta)/eIF-5